MLDICFEGEDSDSDAGKWQITMETEEAFQSLVDIIRKQWEELYCVAITITYTVSRFIYKILYLM